MDEKKDDDIEIDFSAIGNKVKKWFKKEEKAFGVGGTAEESSHKSHHVTSHAESHSSFGHTIKDSEDISLDFKGIASFFTQNKKWLIPLVIILLTFSLSFYLRTMPQRMPIAEEWAQNSAYSFYKNQINTQILSQYPNLPEANRNTMVETQFNEMLKTDGNAIKQQVLNGAEQYRNFFRDDQGTLYLLGIDPWHYYRMVSNVLEYGHQGTTFKEGQSWDMYFVAPEGRPAEKEFHAYFGAFWHRFMNLFGDYPLMYTFFFVGAIFSALAVIPAFFIGKRLTGNNVGGLFTALMIAVTQFFVSRTTGESSDTDIYVVFFPLLITWLFIEAFETKKKWWKYTSIISAGLMTGVFSSAWLGGWWYIFEFLIATIVLYLVYLLFIKESIKQKSFKFNFLDSIKSTEFRQASVLVALYAIVSSLSVILIQGGMIFYLGLLGPLGFLQLKSVAVDSLWPNIYTTVAELNMVPLSAVIEQLGGKMLFYLAILGIIFAALRKNGSGQRDIKMPILLTMWFIASLFATTRGVRFVLQATPVFSIAFGAFAGITYEYATRWIASGLKISKRVNAPIVFILLLLLMIQPAQAGYRQAYQSIPSMNDAWYNALQKIDKEAGNNTILTSWWDFGHWFKAVAKRPVTFDGAAQTSWGAYWVGHSLITADEKDTLGILRMLDCGQDEGFNEVDKIINDTPKSIDILNEVIAADKEDAIRLLKEKYKFTNEQIAAVIKNTHCEPLPEAYYIASEDMVGKSGVWGHFGSWDFYKAEMWQKVHDKEREEALLILKEPKYGLAAEQAEKYYGEIKSTPADRWLSPWPGFMGQVSCSKKEEQMQCQFSAGQGTATLLIDLKEHTAKIPTKDGSFAYPNSIVYATKTEIVEKKFNESLTGFSVIITPDDRVIVSDPLQANGVFTRLFYFKGHSLKCFKPFDQQEGNSGRIYTYKVDWKCQGANNVYFLPKEKVLAQHILVAADKHPKEEALKLIAEVKSKLNEATFAELAKKYSEDPGSAPKGGDLGWFGEGEMVPEFEAVAFALKEGEVSEPVESRFGYHLIKVIGKKTE